MFVRNYFSSISSFPAVNANNDKQSMNLITRHLVLTFLIFLLYLFELNCCAWVQL